MGRETALAWCLAFSGLRTRFNGVRVFAQSGGSRSLIKKLNMVSGYLYFLTNKSMPGLVKIGHTTQDVESRIRQLNSTGVPSPFLLAACIWVADSARVEAKLHSLLAKHRHSGNREFFAGSVADLLRQAMPLLLEATETSGLLPQEPKRKLAYDLEPLTVELLVCLAGEQRMYGYVERH